MGLLEIIVVLGIIGGITKDSDQREPIHITLKKDGIVMTAAKQKQLKYRREYREENPSNAHIFPIENDSRGTVRYPGYEEIPYSSVLYNVDSCEDLQELCNQPLWGTITNKHKGTFTGDVFDCRCSW